MDMNAKRGAGRVFHGVSYRSRPSRRQGTPENRALWMPLPLSLSFPSCLQGGVFAVLFSAPSLPGGPGQPLQLGPSGRISCPADQG